MGFNCGLEPAKVPIIKGAELLIGTNTSGIGPADIAVWRLTVQNE